MYRLVAIFFLLWTLADLTVPQVCMADFAAPSNSAGAANGAYHQDDDCFCCCSHVLPSSFVLIERLKAVSPVEKEDGGIENASREMSDTLEKVTRSMARDNPVKT